MTKLLAFLFIIFLFAVSCKKETEEPLDPGFDYIPVEEGLYQIYSVDSIVWNDYNTTIDTFSYKVKMLISTKYTDNAGNESYKWKKFVKIDSKPWQFSDNYSLSKTNTYYQTNIENIRYVDLIFPVTAGSTWDYNAMNIQNEFSSIYTDIDFSKDVLGKTYDNCVKANFQEEVNLIQEFVHYAIYSRGVGLIYSKNIHKEKKSSGLRGYNVIYKIEENGKE